MKTWLRTFFGLLVLITAVPQMGCAVYDAARDERSVGTIVDDDTILTKVKYRLLKDDDVKGLDISVYSFEGRVYLVGAIEEDKQGDRAVQIARGVKGVRSVDTYFLNRNQLTFGKTFDDTGMTAKVKAKLIGDTDIKSTQVEVKTIMGHVVLLGIVGSERERERIIDHAKMVKYVRKVKSFIRVR
jgi:hyperosmotically inducible protein